MAITLSQANHNANWSVTLQSSLAVAFGSNVTSGSLIVVPVTWADGGSFETVTITDTRGNTYSSASLVRDVSNAQMGGIYWAMNVGSGANTVTMTFPSTRNFSGITVAEFTGLTAPLTVDKATGSITPSTTNHVAGPIITTTNGALVVSSTTRTTGGADAFTLSNTVISNTAAADNQASQYQIQSTSGSVSHTFTYGGAGVGIDVITAFKEITSPVVQGGGPRIITSLTGTRIVVGPNSFNGSRITITRQ